MRQIWLTAIGRDRPGIVARIARVLLEVHDLSCDEVLRVLDKNAPLTSGA